MGIFNNDGSSSNHTCPMPRNLDTSPEKNYLGSLTFRQLNMIISGSCASFVTLVILTLMYLHATHYSRPNEQQKILKVCWLLPIYSCVSFLTIAYPNSFAYLEPWFDFFQSMALASFFLLMCNYISEDAAEREMFFAPMRVEQKKRGQPSTYIGGIEWYRRSWIAIFQYPVVSLVVGIASNITQGANVYCVESSKPYFAHLWLSLIISVSLAAAVLAALRFELKLKKELHQHKPMAKLLAFKLIVGITFIFKIIFWILRSTNALKPTDTLTYADVNMGIQTMATCLVMVPFAIFFPYAYDFRPYLLGNIRPYPSYDNIVDQNKSDRIGGSDSGTSTLPRDARAGPTRYQGGPLGLLGMLAIFDYREIIRGIIFAFRMATEQQRLSQR